MCLPVGQALFEKGLAKVCFTLSPVTCHKPPCLYNRVLSRVTCYNQPLWLNVRLSPFKSVKVRFSPLKAREFNRQNRQKLTSFKIASGQGEQVGSG